MKYFFLLLLSVAFAGNAVSQTLAPCATTELSPVQQTFLKEFQQDQSQVNLRGGSTYYMPIKVHIVGMSDGTGYLEKSEVFRVICDLNDDYADADIYFYLFGEINYINNSGYYEHNWSSGYQMMTSHNVSQAINIYFVKDASGACGYFSPSRDAIAITNSCAGINSSTVAHEVGHYLSLPHTFYGWEGKDMNNPIPIYQQEKVDRSNCTTTGDGFCDTPSDYISDRWNCPYTTTILDPNGDTVVPDGTNYMSYSNDNCQNKFSPQQINAMRAYITQKKNNLIGNSTNGEVAITQPVLVSPTPGETLPTNNVVFNWNKVPNATHYHLEVSPAMAMINKVVDVIITDTFYNYSTLLENKNYKWRVKAFAPGNLCVLPTTVTNFNSGSFATGIVTTEGSDNSFELFPNPLSQSQQLNVVLNFDRNTEGQLEIYSLTGSLLQLHPYNLSSGQKTFTINVSDLNKGIYLIRWNSPEGIFTKRFAITN